jgi:hypothetical protein
VKPVIGEGGDSLPGLAWPVGDFYMPRFASHGRTALVPGAADAHRRLFLVRAARHEPKLLLTLRQIAVNDERALLAWAERWHLTDRWCVLLAQDTLRCWANNPETQGWEFEGTGIFAGFFPFRIEPLQLGPFYHDPTWRRGRDFEKYVLGEVRQALNEYRARIEADALAAGLKRAPRKRAAEHFDWVVRYQVEGESFASIAQSASYKFNGGRQTVRKAIVELAEYISLTLRPST